MMVLDMVLTPSVTVGLPPNYVVGSRYTKKSPIGLGSDVDGMAIKPDGYKIYTTSMTGSNQVKEVLSHHSMGY